MKAQTRVAFVWDWTATPIDLFSWKEGGDGLSRALATLANKYGWFIELICDDKPDRIYQAIKRIGPDIIICWGSLDRPSFAGVKQFGVPVGLCFAGGPTEHSHTDNFDVIFCENEVYKTAFEKQNLNVIQAFGTNDVLFKPLDLKKQWNACYVASFALWKRHNLFAKAMGSNGIAVGNILQNDIKDFEVCIENSVVVLPAVPYTVTPFIYNQSKCSLITASSAGGSQRAVLESMACDIPPIVMSDSDKNVEFVQDSGYGYICKPEVEEIKATVEKAVAEGKRGGREYVLSKYSAEHYADKIYKGFLPFLTKNQK